MSIKQSLSVLTTLAVVFCFGVRAESQLAKRGTYTAQFFWQGHGKWFGVEKDHMFFVGECNGTFFNDSGGGFLHRASAVCPCARDVVKGFGNAHGYCVITDEDDDKATFVWRCKGQERCEGDAEWLGGTGKYTGVKGSHTISVEVLNPLADSGSAVLRGHGSCRSSGVDRPD